jgi:hypothetical protein
MYLKYPETPLFTSDFVLFAPDFGMLFILGS